MSTDTLAHVIPLGIAIVATVFALLLRTVRIELALACVAFALVALDWWFIVPIQGWTECDRGDCGPWFDVFSKGGLVLIGLAVALAIVGVARALRRR